jgi:hypothetical protein
MKAFLLRAAIGIVFLSGATAVYAHVPKPSGGHAADGAQSPLAVGLYCTSGLCQATAYGGSGSGYSFEWVSAAEISDSGGTSYADPNCVWSYQVVGVRVTVSDSSGATAWAEYPVNCGYPEP